MLDIDCRNNRKNSQIMQKFTFVLYIADHIIFLLAPGLSTQQETNKNGDITLGNIMKETDKIVTYAR